MARANGTISCRISGKRGCQPRVDAVTFIPDQSIKHGKREFVAFVPEGAKACGFVAKLRNGRIDLRLGGLKRLDSLLQAALCNTKITVVVSPPPKGKSRPRLKALVVPAE